MKLKITPTEPIIEPVTIQDAKDFLQIDFDTDDQLLYRLIRASRQYIETICGISLVEKEIELEIHGFSSPYMLPYGPVYEIELLEVDGNEVELVGDYVHARGSELHAKYTAAYLEIPEDLRISVLEVLKVYYDGRGANVEIPVFLQHKLNMYSRNLYI